MTNDFRITLEFETSNHAFQNDYFRDNAFEGEVTALLLRAAREVGVQVDELRRDYEHRGTAREKSREFVLRDRNGNAVGRAKIVWADDCGPEPTNPTGT